MTVLRLQPGITYGPVRSRRLGRSLGINLLPGTHKVCSFDCIYCHYGRTQVKTLEPEEGQFPSLEDVLKAVAEALQAHPETEYLTFSGNGEPTLHPRFPAIVAAVRRLRDEVRPDLKLAILSNSTTAHLPAIREALGQIDVPIMKLDAAEPRTVAALNRPVAAVSVETIVAGLKRLPGITIQSLLLDGAVSNVGAEALEAWMSALAEIKPARVQVYSTDRPVPESGIEKVPPAELQRIAAEVEQRTGLLVDAYWAHS